MATRLGLLLRLVGALALGIVAVTLVTMIGDFALSSDRLSKVVSRGFSAGAFNYAQSRSDQFTECSLLMMEALRPSSMARNAVDTYFALDPRFNILVFHPCPQLAYLVIGAGPEMDHSKVLSYVSYPFGARHLAAITLSVFEVATARIVYAVLSYGSLALVLLAAWRRSPRAAMVLTPIVLMLAFASALGAFGGNLAHAPGFVVGFFSVAALIWYQDFFTSFTRRLAFAVFLGVLLTFFDLLHGAIPITLALFIVANQLFYVADSQAQAWRRGLADAVAIALAFFIAYAVYTVLRLGILDLVYDVDIGPYLRGLRQRTSPDVNSALTIGAGDLIAVLWEHRRYLTFYDPLAASIVLFAALAAWIVGLLLLPLVIRDNSIQPTLAVLLLCTFGVLGWYALFPQHSFLHAKFMVRIIALPAGIGFAIVVLIATVLLRPGRLKPLDHETYAKSGDPRHLAIRENGSQH